MEKKVMKRTASDNKYLHRDFHKSMDLGLKYIGEKYGDNGVKQYLRQFAEVYYAPLAAKIRKDGLAPLAEHIAGIYAIEEMPDACEIHRGENELTVRISRCPALAHFSRLGYVASPWYGEATRTVNEVIADLAELSYFQNGYDPENGKCEYTFLRRCL